MKFWTNKETHNWLDSIHVPHDGGTNIHLNKQWHGKRITIPKNSWDQARFSEFLIGEIKPYNGCVLWLTEWGVDPPAENRILIERMRISYGEKRELTEAPTFVFDASDLDAAVAIVRLFTMFGWDGYLVNTTGTYLVMLRGHEGVADVCFKSTDLPPES